jgi:mevalonate kinase
MSEIGSADMNVDVEVVAHGRPSPADGTVALRDRVVEGRGIEWIGK